MCTPLCFCAAPSSAALQEAEEERLRTEFAKQGILIPKKERTEIFDSNTITPGTPFMHRLSIALQYYVHLRLNSDPGWRDIEVRSAVAGLRPVRCAGPHYTLPCTVAY